MHSIAVRNLPYLLIFLVAFALAPNPAAAEDSRAVRARQIRDEILLKRKEAAPTPSRLDNPFEAEVTAARERLAQIDARIEEKRRHSESLAAPREKLAARSEELQVTTTRLQEQNRARVEAVYRSAKLGAGAAGWHPEPARSARLSRYLAAIAAVQGKKLETVEIEHGSAIAALDLARADNAAAAAELRVLDADRAEAEARLERAVADAGRGGATEAGAHDPDFGFDSSPASAQQLAMQQAALAEQIAEQQHSAQDEEPPTADGDEERDTNQPTADPNAATEQAAIELAAAELAAVEKAATEKAATEKAAAATAADKAAAEKAAAETAAAEKAAAETAAETAAESVREIEKAAAELAAKAKAEPTAATAPSPSNAPDETAAATPTPAPPSDAPTAAPTAAPTGDSPSTDAAPVEPGAGAAAETRPPRRVGLLTRIFGDDRDADSFAASRGTLPPPVAGKVVANYGQQHKSGATYRGVILRAGHDAPVKAVAGGQVSFAGDLPGLGNTVIVSHGGRYHTVYARLGSVRVKEGEDVASGADLGELPADNADMHFELRDQGKAIDPLPWLKSGIPGGAP